jgi:hypothetical protein
MKEVNRLKPFQGYMDGKIEIEEASRILKRTPDRENLVKIRIRRT